MVTTISEDDMMEQLILSTISKMPIHKRMEFLTNCLIRFGAYEYNVKYLGDDGGQCEINYTKKQ